MHFIYFSRDPRGYIGHTTYFEHNHPISVNLIFRSIEANFSLLFKREKERVLERDNSYRGGIFFLFAERKREPSNRFVHRKTEFERRQTTFHSSSCITALVSVFEEGGGGGGGGIDELIMQFQTFITLSTDYTFYRTPFVVNLPKDSHG